MRAGTDCVTKQNNNHSGKQCKENQISRSLDKNRMPLPWTRAIDNLKKINYTLKKDWKKNPKRIVEDIPIRRKTLFQLE